MRYTLAHKIIETEKKDVMSIFEEKGKIYTFLNPVSYLDALKNKELFKRFDGIFADGSGLVSAILLFYLRKVTRRSFDMVGIAPMLFNFAAVNEKSVYIIGAKKNEIEKTIGIFCARYPKMKISGYRDGYFSGDEEVDATLQDVVNKKPDFLIVSMGALLQEKVLVRARELGFSGVGFSCGGFVRQTSMNKIDYYPTWVDRWNLRFMYRMAKEKHTRSRYATAVFKFPLMFFKERILG